MSKLLAHRLKEARISMHPRVTQRDIAKRFKVTPGAICLWEKGKTEPSSEVLADLAKIYNVSVDWLTGLDDLHKRENIRVTGITPPIHTVPVVSPMALSKWRLDLVSELLQTSVAYPEGTAAAILVASDALTSVCPTGSYAVISRDHKPTQGSIVLVSNGRVSEPILRRWIQEAGDVLLLADDARWPTIPYSPSIEILGTVVEVTTRKLLYKAA